MGLNNENTRRIVLDIETFPIGNAADYLEPVEAPSNYKDPVKIAAYQVDAQKAQLAKAALDHDLCRIVALGYALAHGVPRDPSGEVVLCKTETDERLALVDLWDVLKPAHFIGYNVLAFDLPVLLRRSLYLGVKAPQIQLDKYRHPQVTDLMMVLSNNGAHKFRSLSFYASRFGLPATDGSGADVAGYVEAGEWGAIEAHLRADLVATAALAQRVGVL